MIQGIDVFREHFAGFERAYALIGGVASTLVMEDAGMQFRATKDFDMVLCVEALDAGFGTAFWEFIRLGGYQNQQHSTGEKIFYRFNKPANAEFPYMLELFSRNPAHIQPADGSHLTPLPIDEAISSLSAILLNDDYYTFLHQHKVQLDGISVVSEHCLIPLKASAWHDLVRRAGEGERVDMKNIKKHKNDILRLFQLLRPHERIALPKVIAQDLERFLQSLLEDEALDLKPFGLADLGIREIVSQLGLIYGIQRPGTK